MEIFMKPKGMYFFIRKHILKKKLRVQGAEVTNKKNTDELKTF